MLTFFEHVDKDVEELRALSSANSDFVKDPTQSLTGAKAERIRFDRLYCIEGPQALATEAVVADEFRVFA